MTDQLKPCPFCGTEDEGLMTAISFGYWVVECAECGSEGPERLADKDAIEAWNRRAEPLPQKSTNNG